MKNMIFGAAVAALALAMPGSAFAQARTPAATIVVVDMDRITQECTACRGAQPALQGLLTSGQQQAQTLGAPLLFVGLSFLLAV